MEVSNKITLTIISLSVVLVVLSTGYKFLLQKDYKFIVEVDCDPEMEVCFVRDCDAGDCPPNELNIYKVFEVSANDFQKCSDNSCAMECSSGQISCVEVVCSESEGDECLVSVEN